MSDRMTSPGEDKEEATRQAIRAHDEAARAVVQSRQPSTRTAEPRTLMDYAPTDPVGRLTFLHVMAAYADAQRAIGRAEAAAPAGLDVERLTEAMDFDRVEAQAIIRKHGFVFARNLAEVTDDSDEAACWEKLAFTLYTMLLPSNRRSEKIAAEYARLLQGTDA